MTDTLKRLAGPTTPRRTTAGTALYTPGSGVVAAVKHAIVTSNVPWDAYIYLSKGAMLTQENRFVNGVMVPAFKTVTIPLDYIVSNAAGDVINARQGVAHTDMYGTASLLPTPILTASSPGNSLASSTVVSGSWTSVIGSLYVATVAWRDTTSIGTISSFSADATHGATWVEICTHTAPHGNLKIAHYATVTTAAAAGTTTVNFSSAPDAAAIVLTTCATIDLFDTTLAQGENAICCAGAANDPRSGALNPVYAPFSDRPILSNRVAAMAAVTTYTSAVAPTGWTEMSDAVTNQSLYTANFLGTATGVGGSFAPVITGAGDDYFVSAYEILPGRIAHSEPLSVTLHGVEVTA